MSGSKLTYDMTEEFLELFLSTLDTEDDRAVVRQIVTRFAECGLPVKTKRYDTLSMAGTMRIVCHVRKSAEAVIVNNRGMSRDSLSIQVRIDDRDVFEELDKLGPNVRNQILNAGNCGFCSPKCDGKRYVFAYDGNEYAKCRTLCSNFFFQNIGPDDVSGLMRIINGEIAYKQARNR